MLAILLTSVPSVITTIVAALVAGPGPPRKGVQEESRFVVHPHQGFDLLHKPGEVPVPPLHVCERQPPVVRGHVHGILVIANILHNCWRLKRHQHAR